MVSRPLVMGVLNVTPDSFSDGGLWLDPTAAAAHARALVDEGADIIDVGGESTRPGAGRIPLEEELERTLPVVTALVSAGMTVSVDTMRAEVASRDCDVILMHWRGHSHDMQARATYDDVTAEVVAELRARVEDFASAGVAPDRLILDPGLGFAKTFEHNWRLVATLPDLLGLGHRVIVGTSRKGFLGAVGRTGRAPRPPLDRDVATAVTSAYLADAGVWAVRVHDVRSTVDALDVAEALRRSRERAGDGSADR